MYSTVLLYTSCLLSHLCTSPTRYPQAANSCHCVIHPSFFLPDRCSKHKFCLRTAPFINTRQKLLRSELGFVFLGEVLLSLLSVYPAAYLPWPGASPRPQAP